MYMDIAAIDTMDMDICGYICMCDYGHGHVNMDIYILKTHGSPLRMDGCLDVWIVGCDLISHEYQLIVVMKREENNILS